MTRLLNVRVTTECNVTLGKGQWGGCIADIKDRVTRGLEKTSSTDMSTSLLMMNVE